MDDDFEAQGLLRDISLGAYEALTVSTAPDGDHVLGVEVKTDQYGVGPALDDALSALAEALSEYHEFLRNTGASRLSPHLREHLEFLDSHRIADSPHVRQPAV